jgi:hypothetical protein
MNTDSQEIRIQRWLTEGHTLTPLEALHKFGCFRLGARIHALRKLWPIESRMVKTESGAVVAEYWMPKARRAS